MQMWQGNESAYFYPSFVWLYAKWKIFDFKSFINNYWPKIFVTASSLEELYEIFFTNVWKKYWLILEIIGIIYFANKSMIENKKITYLTILCPIWCKLKNIVLIDFNLTELERIFHLIYSRTCSTRCQIANSFNIWNYA